MTNMILDFRIIWLVGRSPGFAQLSCFNSTSHGAGKQPARCRCSWTKFTAQPTSLYSPRPTGWSR